MLHAILHTLNSTLGDMPVLLASDNKLLGQFMMVVAFIILIAVFLRRANRKSKLAKKQFNESLTAPRTISPGRHKHASQQSSLSDHASRLEVNLNEMSRDLMAQLDSKASIIQALIADADRAANRLEAALETLETTAQSMNDSGLTSGTSVSTAQSVANLKSAISGLNELEQSVGQFIGSDGSVQTPQDSRTSQDPPASSDGSDEQFKPDWPADAGADAGSNTDATPSAGKQHSSGTDPRYQEIYTLADYGHEPLEIASRVGLPVGKVQLILGLRQG